MSALWSNEFKLVTQFGRSATWAGKLRPRETEYEVEISYTAPLAIENFSLRIVQPRVSVNKPLLTRHPVTWEKVPHVYQRESDPSRPYLCLFDPRTREWTPEKLIADTTVPWTAWYLYNYEAWRITGKWCARERHPDLDEYVEGKRTTPLSGIEDGPSTSAILAGQQAF
jgi:hypothetical protein